MLSGLTQNFALYYVMIVLSLHLKIQLSSLPPRSTTCLNPRKLKDSSSACKHCSCWASQESINISRPTSSKLLHFPKLLDRMAAAPLGIPV